MEVTYSGKFYLVTVLGKNGYSFMVKTVLEDESKILERCCKRNLFNYEGDVLYAYVSEADKNVQKHFDEFYSYLDM